MKLISKFHDYYDGAVRSFANEELPFYNRITEKLTIDDRNWNIDRKLITTIIYREKKSSYWYDSSNTRELLVFGICGKLYVVYSYIDNEINCRSPLMFDNKNNINIFENEFDIIRHKFSFRKNIPGWYVSELYQKYSITESVNHIKRNSHIYDIFYKYNTPIFIYRPLSNTMFDTKNLYPNLIINPCLRDFEFQKVIDSYTIVQELNMFLNNDLVKDKQPVIPVGNDVQLAESKGFDKWSFRKLPQRIKK